MALLDQNSPDPGHLEKTNRCIMVEEHGFSGIGEVKKAQKRKITAENGQNDHETVEKDVFSNKKPKIQDSNSVKTTEND